MITNGEVDAVLSVLWYTHAIRARAEDCALSDDEGKWKRNGGLFPNFSRYHTQKWKQMMGPDDPTVGGRRISEASMANVRRDFEESYRKPIILALELAGRVRAAVTEAAVTEAIKKKDFSEDGAYDDEVVWMKACDEVGMKAWQMIASEPWVREKIAELTRNWGYVDATSIQLKVDGYSSPAAFSLKCG